MSPQLNEPGGKRESPGRMATVHWLDFPTKASPCHSHALSLWNPFLCAYSFSTFPAEQASCMQSPLLDPRSSKPSLAHS